MRTTTALSRRQVGATRHARNFLAVSRAFLSSRVPERAPEGRGWPELAGWMKAQIRTKKRIRWHDWTVFHRPDEKKGCQGLAWLEKLLGHLQRADPFRTPNRSDLVRMGQSADSQSGFVRIGRGVHPAARRKIFIDFFSLLI
jgi:hypothetical protein